jgi:hypothetical protein
MNLASAFKSIGNDAKGAAPAAGHAVDDTGNASEGVGKTAGGCSCSWAI